LATGQFEILTSSLTKEKEVPAKAQRRKGVELYLIFADFFASLRLCGNLLSIRAYSAAT
jgi:hypothetical protein